MKKFLFMGAVALAALTSCGNKDLYDENYVEAKNRQTYEANFTKLYGAVSSDYSWDATLLGMVAQTRAGETPISESDMKVSTDWYEVEQPTLDYMDANLPEQTYNKDKGKAFTMTAPNNAFTIVPIYQ